MKTNKEVKELLIKNYTLISIFKRLCKDCADSKTQDNFFVFALVYFLL